MALRSGMADVNGREVGVRGDLMSLPDCRANSRDRSDCIIALSLVVMTWNGNVFDLEPD